MVQAHAHFPLWHPHLIDQGPARHTFHLQNPTPKEIRKSSSNHLTDHPTSQAQHSKRRSPLQISITPMLHYPMRKALHGDHEIKLPVSSDNRDMSPPDTTSIQTAPLCKSRKSRARHFLRCIPGKWTAGVRHMLCSYLSIVCVAVIRTIAFPSREHANTSQ
jgi:hypothetical protein